MENLIRFITKNSPWFTWLFLAIVSIVLLCQTNPYHRSIWFSSANFITANVYDFQNNVTGYFGLRQTNDEILERTGQLIAENQALRKQLQQYQDLGHYSQDSAEYQYHYVIAHVVGNTINQAENYITLDKGSVDGIHQDLGVADQNGVIGIVANVSEHYSLVLSVLNPKLRLSVMLKGTESFGSLVWDGKDSRYANLEDLPRNVDYNNGDTIVTTGYTSSFPKDIPVGRVVDTFDEGGSFLTLQIELFPNFNRLNSVHVIYFDGQAERDELQQTVEPNDN
jgi:rod shape-determining protein MreC